MSLNEFTRRTCREDRAGGQGADSWGKLLFGVGKEEEMEEKWGSKGE